MTVETKDLAKAEIEFLSKQNIKLCEQMENAEEILSQHEAYISLLENKNQQIKELLKECRDVIEWYKGDCGYKDVPTESVLTKIDEVLK